MKTGNQTYICNTLRLNNGKKWTEKIAIITNSGKSERGQCGTQTLQLLLTVVVHKAYYTYTHTPKTAYEE